MDKDEKCKEKVYLVLYTVSCVCVCVCVFVCVWEHVQYWDIHSFGNELDVVWGRV